MTEYSALTETQKRVLRMMSNMSIGAIRINNAWIWPKDIRNSNDTAHVALSWFSGVAFTKSN